MIDTFDFFYDATDTINWLMETGEENLARKLRSARRRDIKKMTDKIKITNIDWDNIDDKALMNAYDRAKELRGQGMGFSKQDAMNQTLREFPQVDKDDLLNCFLENIK